MSLEVRSVEKGGLKGNRNP